MRMTWRRSRPRSRRRRQRKTVRAFVVVHSHIAWGAPKKHDTAGAHGEPLGDEEIRPTKKVYGWPEDAQFLVPRRRQRNTWVRRSTRGARWEADWHLAFSKYKKANPDLAKQFEAMEKRELPEGWDAKIRRSRQTRRESPRANHPASRERDRRDRALDVRRLRRPCAIYQDVDLWRERFREGKLRWTQLPLWHPRTRDGRHPERDVLVEAAPVRRGLPHLHRLHARGHAPLRHHGPAGHLHLHA